MNSKAHLSDLIMFLDELLQETSKKRFFGLGFQSIEQIVELSQKVGQGKEKFLIRNSKIEQKKQSQRQIVFKMQNPQETDCVICVPQTINAKKTSLIVLKLLKIVENQKRKQKKLVSLPSQLYFKQLVDYLKLDLSKNKTTSTQCGHKTLKNYLTKKLAISLDDLYCLSQHIFNTVGKRKFELELVQKIAKNIHEKVVQTSTNQQNLEANIKNTKQFKAKTSLDAQDPTVHCMQSQKKYQNKFFDQNQQFSKLMDYRQMQNSTEFQDQSGFCLPNYDMGLNGMFHGFYGPELGPQEFHHQIEQIQMLVSSGYFMGQRVSMRQ